MVSKSKQRQNELYDLKDRAINKMLNDGLLKPIKIHYKTSIQYELIFEDEDEEFYYDKRLDGFEYHVPKREAVEKTDYFLLLSDDEGEFTFHTPIGTEQINQYPDLTQEQLDGIISSEVTRKTKLKFYESVKLLKEYIN